MLTTYIDVFSLPGPVLLTTITRVCQLYLRGLPVRKISSFTPCTS